MAAQRPCVVLQCSCALREYSSVKPPRHIGRGDDSHKVAPVTDEHAPSGPSLHPFEHRHHGGVRRHQDEVLPRGHDLPNRTGFPKLPGDLKKMIQRHHSQKRTVLLNRKGVVRTPQQVFVDEGADSQVGPHGFGGPTHGLSRGKRTHQLLQKNTLVGLPRSLNQKPSDEDEPEPRNEGAGKHQRPQPHKDDEAPEDSPRSRSDLGRLPQAPCELPEHRAKQAAPIQGKTWKKVEHRKKKIEVPERPKGDRVGISDLKKPPARSEKIKAGSERERDQGSHGRNQKLVPRCMRFRTRAGHAPKNEEGDPLDGHPPGPCGHRVPQFMEEERAEEEEGAHSPHDEVPDPRDLGCERRKETPRHRAQDQKQQDEPRIVQPDFDAQHLAEPNLGRACLARGGTPSGRMGRRWGSGGMFHEINLHVEVGVRTGHSGSYCGRIGAASAREGTGALASFLHHPFTALVLFEPYAHASSMTKRIDLPVLPLRDTVVYPGVAVPISAGRPGTVAAVQAAMEGERRLFAVAQKENVDQADPDGLFTVGTVVRILQTHRVRGGVQLLVQGEERAQALGYEELDDGSLMASMIPLERFPPRSSEDPAFQALDKELRDRAAELGTRRGVPAEALNQLISGVGEPGSFADLVAFYLDLPTQQKQKLLEVLDDEERMRRTLVAVERELVRLDAQEEIQARVQEELGERQREMLLREQMRQIQRELGDEDDRKEVEELRERIEVLDLEVESRAEVDRELRRLQRTSPNSAEYQVIRTFLEWVTELPWGDRTNDQIDLRGSKTILDEDHYGLDEVKDRVLEFLAVRKLQMERAIEEDAEAEDAEDTAPGSTTSGSTTSGSTTSGSTTSDTNRQVRVRAAGVGRGPILLFAGPPGVGKTSIAQSIARALGRKYVRISLGGARDEADIRGHRRTYVGAMPGRIIQGMRQVGSRNPVFLLDEVDKLGVSFQGDPSSALLEVLDPAQNATFTDHYLGIPFDLSEVLFVATANDVDRIPAPLLDRMERVDFSGYTEQEKLEIARRYLLPRQQQESGLREQEFSPTDDTLRGIISKYTREAGVRQLERELGKLARKLARKVAEGAADSGAVSPEQALALLGRPRVHPEKVHLEDRIGVATGMFYTPMGGDIMFVEAGVARGDGGLILTGQLGDVMKESGRAAWSYAKAHYADYGISEDRLKGTEVHIHVPAGAIPKDGPSAGITMATSLISVLSGRPVRRDVAMTGELTLTGRVLPIGGIKEKVLGAIRAGIATVILPAENAADLEDIPAEVQAGLEIRLVENLDQVLEHALVPTPGNQKAAARRSKTAASRAVPSSPSATA